MMGMITVYIYVVGLLACNAIHASNIAAVSRTSFWGAYHGIV